MKRMMAMMLVVTLAIFAACAGIQINQDQEQIALVAAKATARIAGYEFAKKVPDKVEGAVVVCQQMAAATDMSGAQAVMDLVTSYGKSDPLVAATVADLLTLVQIQPGVTIPADKLPLMKAVAAGFLEGMKMQMQMISDKPTTPRITLVANSPDLYANSGSGYFTLGQLVKLEKADPEAARFYVETVIDTLCTVSNAIGMDLLQLKPPLVQDADKVVRLTLEQALKKEELYDRPAHQIVWFVVMTLSKPKA